MKEKASVECFFNTFRILFDCTFLLVFECLPVCYSVAEWSGVRQPQSLLQLSTAGASAQRSRRDDGGEAAAGVSLREHADIGRAVTVPGREEQRSCRRGRLAGDTALPHLRRTAHSGFWEAIECHPRHWNDASGAILDEAGSIGKDPCAG